ncbi:plasmid maintenance protein (plasmid) [Borreliella andersonii]|uniref:Plasmid maintenance protein n=2 Tax=Borrelia andersonii TaxID=42109 RepID=A0ACD5G6E4_BORAD
MKKLNLKIQPNVNLLKKYQIRYYKILSILKYFQKNAIKYNQKVILNTLNYFLAKDGLNEVALRTLRKDLTWLCNKNIIKKTLLRLGEGNGSYIRYSTNKYSNNNLNCAIKDKQNTIEHDANTIYKFTKETQKKYFKNKRVKVSNLKNATKNASHIIKNNKKYINNKTILHKAKKEDLNFTDLKIQKLLFLKRMYFLDKMEENSNKKKYLHNRIKIKEWLERIKNQICDDK